MATSPSHAVPTGRGDAAVEGRAKRPLTPLAGPYGHPFHPIAVTIPIGAWTLSFVFDLVSRWAGEDEVFVKASFWLIGAGIVGAVLAALLGLMDLTRIPRGTPVFRTGLTYLALNTVVLVLYAVSFLLRRDHLDEGDVTVGAFVLSAIALATLGVSGWLGGKLAYHYGVRVADDATQAEGFRPASGTRTTS
ncbi:MAG TPA: DUF2231 domain-containing protein [Acidimicrobiales bacterium]|nr:DUF2231 domain-containing protein [Acidimicrobiales bacterium]